MNKKAIAFGIMLVLVTIAAISVSFYYFVHDHNKKLQNAFTAEAISNFEEEQSRLKYYGKESIKLSAYNALYSMTRKSLVYLDSSCLVYGETYIWSDFCKPSNLESWFSEEFDSELKNLLDAYPKKIAFLTSMDKDLIKINIKLMNNTTSNLTLEYAFDINFNLTENNLSLTEFENLYAQVQEAKSKCNTDTECIKKEIKLEDWDIQVIQESGYLLFTLETKKSYFLNRGGILSFEKIKLKFAF